MQYHTPLDTRILRITWDRRVSPSARQIYAWLDDRADDTGSVSVSYAQLAEVHGYTRNGAKIAVNQLVAAGYVEREYAITDTGRQLPNTYRLASHAEA